MAGLDPRRATLRKIIERRRMWSILNATRWNVLAAYLDDLRPKVRAKLVSDDDEPHEWSRVIQPCRNYIEPIAVGPVLCLEIEWLDIDPRTTVATPGQDQSAAIETFLHTSKIPFSLNGGIIRVWGHIAPEVNVVFA